MNIIKNKKDWDILVSQLRNKMDFETCIIQAKVIQGDIFNPDDACVVSIDMLGDRFKEIHFIVNSNDLDLTSEIAGWMLDLFNRTCLFSGYELYKTIVILHKVLRISMYRMVVDIDVKFFADMVQDEDIPSTLSLQELDFAVNQFKSDTDKDQWFYWKNVRKRFCTAVFAHMHEVGMRVDKEKLLELREAYSKAKDFLAHKIFDTVLFMASADKSSPSVNYLLHASPKDISTVVYKRHVINVSGIDGLIVQEGNGLRIQKDGESVSPALIDVSRDSMELYSKKPCECSDIFKYYTFYNHISNTLSTILGGTMLSSIKGDGKVHPEYGFAKTGRPTSSHPSILNVPKKAPKEIDEFNKTFEDYKIPYHFFECVTGGRRVIAYDYKAAEMYALAYLSGDKKMQEALDNGDPHMEVVKSIPCDGDPKKYRKAGKISNYAIPYGISEKAMDVKISQILGFSISGLAKKLLTAYKENFPDAWRCLNETFDFTKTHYIFVNELGRKYVFDKDYPYPNLLKCSMKNFPLQNMVADCLQVSAVKVLDLIHDLNRNGDSDIEMFMAQYDSVVLSMKHNKNTEEVLDKEIPLLMSNCLKYYPFELRFSIPTEKEEYGR